MTLARLTEMATLIQQVFTTCFKDETHFGKIPGTDKPTLFQAGAQKFALLFHLTPSFEWERLDLRDGHREYIVKAVIKSGGNFVAEGVGSCSSMESKYRFRNAELGYTPTGNIVPQSYFKLKNPAEKRRALETIMDEKGRWGIKKVNNVWQIVKFSETSGEKVEHPNIADVYNTIFKMAKKRAYVDAVLNATGASDMFTQDLEDMEENVERLWAMDAEKETRHDAHEAGQASSPSGEEKRSQRQSSRDSDASREESESTSQPQKLGMDWKAVTCHIGKATKGRRLGDLDAASLMTIKEKWADAYDFTEASLQDKKLKLAIEIAVSEMAKRKESKEPESPKQTEFKPQESKPEEEDTIPDIGTSDSKDLSEAVDRLKKLIGDEGMTEEEFIACAKRNKGIPETSPWRNADDIDDETFLIFISSKWDEIMVKWGERKPAKKKA